MKIEIKVPEAGESVTEAMISQWFKKDGETVETDEPLLEFETDKANMELPAEDSGRLHIKVEAGEVVEVGQVIGIIDTDAASQTSKSDDQGSEKCETPDESEEAEEPEDESPGESRTEDDAEGESSTSERDEATESLSPAVRRLISEKGLDPSQIQGTGKDGRILKKDVMDYLADREADTDAEEPEQPERPRQPADEEPESEESKADAGDRTRVVPMSMLRRKIAKRLVEAQNNAAILTTFNEVDMSTVMALRARYKEPFVKAYGVKLGMMSFFVKAAVEALRSYPEINAEVSGTDIVYHDAIHIGVAVGTDRGLVVPIIRDADQLNFAQIEKAIASYADQAREGKLSLDDLYGGTFTISNGGIYGNLLSTPILNPPQSGILGMHKIEKRPRVVNDEIVIRPMMYLALSYDHRIVDGKEAVGFLLKIKDCLEDPARILLEI